VKRPSIDREKKEDKITPASVDKKNEVRIGGGRGKRESSKEEMGGAGHKEITESWELSKRETESERGGKRISRIWATKRVTKFGAENQNTPAPYRTA